MRKRFNKQELEIIGAHAVVEWRNVSTWGYLALITSAILTDEFRTQYVEAENVSHSTPTVRHGEKIRIYPTYLRAFDSTKTYR